MTPTPSLDEREDACAVDAEGGVAFELGLGELAVDGAGGFLGAALPGGAGAGLFFFFGALEAGEVEGDAGVAGSVDHEVERHSEGLVKAKGFGPADGLLCTGLGRDQVVKMPGAHLHHPCELLLFGEHSFADAVGGFAEFGVGDAHLVADGVDHLVHEGLFLAEEAAVADAAAEDLAEDVAAAFVGGEDAVGDEEGGGAGVVGDDAERGCTLGVADGLLLGCEAGEAGELGGARDERGEEVGLVVRELALEDAAMRSRPMPVSMEGLGSGVRVPSAAAVELHEDEVPDLRRSAGRPRGKGLSSPVSEAARPRS